MNLHRPFAAACLLVALAGSVTACGGDSPTDASEDDFCGAITDVSDALDALVDPDTPASKKQWSAIQESYDQLAEVGTPEGVSTDQREGFELLVESMSDLAEEQSGGDPESSEVVPDVAEGDQDKVDDFLAYSLDTCAAGAQGRQPADPDLPDCAEVWVAGTVLPLDFAGCNDDGRVVDTEPTQDCDDGTSRLFYHRTGPGERDVEMLAITGQKIQEYSLDIDSDLYNECHDTTLDD